MSLDAALQLRGVRLSPWNRDARFKRFAFETVNGLLHLEGVVRLVAVINDQKGNGSFERFMEALETVAKDHAVEVQVVQIWSDYLKSWFEKRGYSIAEDKELGSYAVLRQ